MDDLLLSLGKGVSRKHWNLALKKLLGSESPSYCFSFSKVNYLTWGFIFNFLSFNEIWNKKFLLKKFSRRLPYQNSIASKKFSKEFFFRENFSFRFNRKKIFPLYESNKRTSQNIWLIVRNFQTHESLVSHSQFSKNFLPNFFF